MDDFCYDGCVVLFQCGEVIDDCFVFGGIGLCVVYLGVWYCGLVFGQLVIECGFVLGDVVGFQC